MYKRKKNGNFTKFLYKFYFAFQLNKWRFCLTCWSKLVKSVVVDLLLNQRNRHKEKLLILKKSQNCRKLLKPLRKPLFYSICWHVTTDHFLLMIGPWLTLALKYYCKGLVHFKLQISSNLSYMLHIPSYWSTRQGTYLLCIMYL